MLEAVGDIWELAGHGVIVITTSGSVAKSGKAVIGRGVARQALERFPDIAETLGRFLTQGGNHVFELGHGIVSFPVEETAWSLPDPRIIIRSARELREMADVSGWERIMVPRPGCGGGGLLWQDIKPLLEPWLDERFTVLCR